MIPDLILMYRLLGWFGSSWSLVVDLLQFWKTTPCHPSVSFLMTLPSSNKVPPFLASENLNIPRKEIYYKTNLTVPTIFVF